MLPVIEAPPTDTVPVVMAAAIANDPADCVLAIAIVFVLLSAPMEIVLPLPVIERFPLGVFIVTAPDPAEFPIVVLEFPVVLTVVVPVMAAPFAVTVKPPAVTVKPPVVTVIPALVVKVPVTAVFPVALPMFTAPVPPVPIVVTPAPVAFRLTVPAAVKLVNVAAAATVPPIAGGDANTAGRFDGMITVLVEIAPAIA